MVTTTTQTDEIYVSITGYFAIAASIYTADSYFSGCMHKRNRHLVRYSGYCVAYSVKTGGGTAYTIDYAARNGLKIVNLAEFLQR